MKLTYIYIYICINITDEYLDIVDPHRDGVQVRLLISDRLIVIHTTIRYIYISFTNLLYSL